MPLSFEMSRSIESEALKLNRAHGTAAVAFARDKYAVIFGAGTNAPAGERIRARAHMKSITCRLRSEYSGAKNQ